MNGVEVCNLALGYIGQGASRPIESITGSDTSEAARACVRLFQPSLDQMLRAWRWGFAMKAASLAMPAGVEIPGYRYAYTYPTDCLFLHGLCDESTDPTRDPSTLVPFKRFGLYIASDLPDAWALYTVRLADTSTADPLFNEALAWHLAEKLAIHLKADPRMAQYAGERARVALSIAQSAAANEAGHDPQPDAENIRVRGGVVRPFPVLT